MLFVLNKEKIISYMIAFSTVAVLLCISVVSLRETETIQTSSNSIIQNTENIINKTIYGE